MMEAIVTADSLTRVFDVSEPWLNRVIERKPRQTLVAVSDVSFAIEPNTVYGLVGESGSGKSTIGKIVVGLLRPTSGSVRISIPGDSGMKRGGLAGRAQMIFQDPFASLNPRWKIRDIVLEPVRDRKSEAGHLVERNLRLVGLSESDASKYPHEFSGGQRQRIAIARALVSNPSLIVCDEPTSALDVSIQAQVLNLMSDLREELGLTYLFISHDLAVIQHMADRIGVLYLGRLVEESSTARLFDSPMHPYTRMLLSAAPRIDSFGRRGDPPKGEIPDPVNPPSGCAYYPRCPIAMSRCATERPKLRPVGGDSRVACHAVSG